MSGTHLFVGLDAGGSKTHLVAQCPELPEQIERRAAGANPNRIGIEGAADVLVELIEAAVQECPGVNQISVCAGVAGASQSTYQATLAEALRSAVSCPVVVEVVHDALIALDAAYDVGSGLVVIAGTGSVVLGRTTDGDLLRAGGWGPKLGDEGSGYGIGRAGLRAVAETFDGGCDTALRTRLRENCGINDREELLEKVYQEEVPVESVAPFVIDSAKEGDDVASRILTTQAAKLCEQVEWILNRRENITRRMTLLGGMVQNEFYTDVLRRTLHDHIPDWSVEVLQVDPVVGALRRAHRLEPT